VSEELEVGVLLGAAPLSDEFLPGTEERLLEERRGDPRRGDEVVQCDRPCIARPGCVEEQEDQERLGECDDER
jgi:hypothetical protein